MVDRSNWRAYGLMIFTTWCWGLNSIFSRLAVGEISPMQLVMFRWLGVIIILWVFTRKHLAQDWPILKTHLLFLGVIGSAGFTIFNYFFYLGGHHTGAINIGILQGSIPIFVLLFSFLAFRKRVSPIQAIGILVTLLGVVIVTSGGSWRELQAFSINRGDLYIIIACFFYAVYAVALTRRPKVSAISLFTVMAVSAWIVSLPLLAFEVLQQGWQAPTSKGWLIALVVAVLPSLLAQVFFIQSVALIGANRAGAFINLIPIFAAIMAVIFLQESFELYHAISLALVLGGIILSEFGRNRLSEKRS